MFYEVELVTQKKNFYENFRVSNSKCDVILRTGFSNSILLFENSEPRPYFKFKLKLNKNMVLFETNWLTVLWSWTNKKRMFLYHA